MVSTNNTPDYQSRDRTTDPLLLRLASPDEKLNRGPVSIYDLVVNGTLNPSSLTHSLTHARTHAPTHSLTQALTHSLSTNTLERYRRIKKLKNKFSTCIALGLLYDQNSRKGGFEDNYLITFLILKENICCCSHQNRPSKTEKYAAKTVPESSLLPLII